MPPSTKSPQSYSLSGVRDSAPSTKEKFRHERTLATAIVPNSGARPLARCQRYFACEPALAYEIPNTKANFTPSDLFASFADQERIAAEFRGTYGNTDNLLLVLVLADDVVSLPSLRYIHHATRALGKLPNIERVESLTTVGIPGPKPTAAAQTPQSLLMAMNPQTMLIRAAAELERFAPRISGDEVTQEEADDLKQALKDAPLVTGRLISAQHDLATVTLFLNRNVTSNASISATVNHVEAWVHDNPPPQGVEIRLAGLPHVRAQVIQKMRADHMIMLPAAVIVSLLVLLLAFRWLPAIILPISAVGLSGLMVVGAMAWANEPFNILNNIIPLLVLIIGISDGIHLIGRYGEVFREQPDRKVASAATFQYMAVACFLTSATTAAGFFSLAVSKTELLRRFGITAGLGVMVVYVVTILWIPALLTWVSPPRRLAQATHDGATEAWLGSLTQRIVRHPMKVLMAAVVALCIGIAGTTFLRVDNAVLDQLDANDEVYLTTRLIERKLYGVRPLELNIHSQTPGRTAQLDVLNGLDTLARWAKSQPGVLQTTSPGDFLHEAWYVRSGDIQNRTTPFSNQEGIDSLLTLLARVPNSALPMYLGAQGKNARLSVQLEDMGAQATIQLAQRLRNQAKVIFGDNQDIDIELTGDAYSGSLGLDVIIRDLLFSLATAFVIIFGVLTLILRDVRLGLLSIPPNALPLLLTMAYMAARDIPLNAATVIIFSVSIGLAVDGTIHLLARFREEFKAGLSMDEALVRAARGTGKAIILTYLALICGFAVMFTSSFVPVRRFGELISITVFGCMIATLVLLPALLKIGYRRRGPTTRD
ncbi:MAG: MMPL family transporter [Myxococcota bacterium]